MCTYCGWSRHVDNLSRSLLFQQSYNSVLTSWKNPVTGPHVQRSHVLDCCHGPKEVYTEWCNISYHSFLPPTILSSLFLSFLSPQYNLIRLDCPWPQAQVAMWRCILPPFPLSLYWFLQSRSGLIDVQKPYITVQPSLSSWWLQSCHTARSIRVTPAVHTDHCLRKHIYKLQTSLCLKRHGEDNANDYSQVIAGVNEIIMS